MISRTTLQAPSWPTRHNQPRPAAPALPSPATRAAARPGLWAGPFAPWLRFLLVVLIACGLTCVYLWQLSTIATIQYTTNGLQQQIGRMEQSNVDLMLQVAAQNTPAQVEEGARQLGMQLSTPSVYVPVPQP